MHNTNGPRLLFSLLLLLIRKPAPIVITGVGTNVSGGRVLFIPDQMHSTWKRLLRRSARCRMCSLKIILSLQVGTAFYLIFIKERMARILPVIDFRQ